MAMTLAELKAYILQCYAERQRQNPVERPVQRLWVMTQAVMASTPTVSSVFWHLAFFWVVHLINSMSCPRSRALGDGSKSPMELFYSIRPDARKWRTFGSVVTWPRTGVVGKLELRNEVGIWCGLDILERDLVLGYNKKKPKIRSGVQPLWLDDADRPMSHQELVDILAGNTDATQPASTYMIQAAGKEVFNLKRWWLNRQTAWLKASDLSSEDEETSQNPVPPEGSSGLIGDVVNFGINTMVGLTQPVDPVSIAGRTRGKMKEAIAQKLAQLETERAAAEEEEVRLQPAMTRPQSGDGATTQDLNGMDVSADDLPLQLLRPDATLQSEAVLCPVGVLSADRTGEDTTMEVDALSSTPSSDQDYLYAPTMSILALDPELREANVEGMVAFLSQAGGIPGGLSFPPAVFYGRKRTSDDEPSWGRVVNMTNNEDWLLANDKEGSDLVRRGQIRDLTEALNSGAQPWPPEWQFIDMLTRCTTKRSTTGEFLRRKVRWALMGNRDLTEFPGRNETYSPSAKWSTFFLFIALAAHFGFKVSSLDITAAFGYTPYDRPFPMYFRTTPAHNRDGQVHIYQVMCVMYWLQEASRKFFDLISRWLTVDMKWTQGKLDPCAFFRPHLRALLSTDDFLIAEDATPEGAAACELTRKEFQARFDITIDHDGQGYIGVCIRQSGNEIALSMPEKIKKLKELIWPELAHDEWPNVPVLEAAMPGWSEVESDLYPPCDNRLFRSIIGQAVFIVKVRNDAMPMISFLSGRSHCATELDMQAAIHLALYICYTRDLEKVFKFGSQEARDFLHIAGCMDAAFRSHVRTSHSHIGSGFKIVDEAEKGIDSGSGMFMVESRSTRGLVPTHVAAAEVNAGSAATKSAIYLRELIETDFIIPLAGPITLDEDNQATMDVVTNYSPQSKNMQECMAGINFMKSAAVAGIVKFHKVGTKEQRANNLTKLQGAKEHCANLIYYMGDSPVAREMIIQAEQRQTHRAAVLHPSVDSLRGASSLFASSLQQETAKEGEDDVVYPCLTATSLEGLLEDLELLGGVESAQESMNADFQTFLQCCTELHEWEAAQSGCALISTAIAEGIVLDTEESNLILAATNRDSYVQEEVDHQRRMNFQRAFQDAPHRYAPATLFWGYEQDGEEMELLRQTQQVAIADREQRRSAAVVGEDWTGKGQHMATTIDLEQRLSVARQIRLFEHDEWSGYAGDDFDDVVDAGFIDGIRLHDTTTVHNPISSMKGGRQLGCASTTLTRHSRSSVYWMNQQRSSREIHHGSFIAPQEELMKKKTRQRHGVLSARRRCSKFK